jgi:glycine cleavage system transcriptional repressor
MAHELIVTAIGPDRKGLAAEITSYIHQAGGNLADARMLNLRGRFAVVALVEGNQETLSRVRAALTAAAEGLGVRLDFSAGEADKGVAGVPYRVKTYSMDQPGIVHRFSALLKDHHVNIEELETRLESAPFMGTPVFTMELLVTVPPSSSLRELKKALSDLGDAMNADVDIESASSSWHAT